MAHKDIKRLERIRSALLFDGGGLRKRRTDTVRVSGVFVKI
jgi:hypothetical protein